MFCERKILPVLMGLLLVTSGAWAEDSKYIWDMPDEQPAMNMEQPALVPSEEPVAADSVVTEPAMNMEDAMPAAAAPEPAAAVEEPTPAIPEPAPAVEEPAPAVEEPTPAAAPAEAATDVSDETKILAGCFAALEQKMTAEDLEQFKKKPVAQLSDYDYTLGTAISDDWVKPSGSPVREYFNKKGVFSPAEISKLVLISFHHHVNNTNLSLEQDIADLKNHANAQAQKNAEAQKKMNENKPEAKSESKSESKKKKKGRN